MPRNQDQTPLPEATVLRRQAEKRLKTEAPPVRIVTDTQLLHELQVHQVELEMQNAELRRARDDAEKILEKYSDLYDFAPVGYFTLDRDGIISAANITGATLLGIERSRLVGRKFGEFIAAETRPAFSVFLDKVFTNSSKESCELALLREKAGSLCVQIEAVSAASGQECRAAIVDISARSQLEEKLFVLHNELATYAAELEAANIDLEAFNYSVSHDLRGPLAVIAGYCDLVEELLGSKPDEKCRGFIQEIHESARQLGQLIDTLLDFSRVKHAEMCHEQVDLSRMAKEVSLTLKVANPERRDTFRIATGITVDGDAGLLRVVLDNLIGNAWKYCGKQDETVIEFGVTAVDGKPAYFVRDNGPGFDMAFADKLFLPFQRLPGTEVAGHGIGLATVDRIVSRHGGRVWAESKPGEGATFYFTLA